ncbi:hypothetical protein [Pararhodobacter oceanensis]|uniref:hypothetical protein n=1 Tax=Pararhodobacter oceanensis TaxID=2172121 RepID=UPI001403D456|nr:hypothetical protein [Pararhodobacter oceanensis]
MSNETELRLDLEKAWKPASVRFDWSQGLHADRGLVERFFNELSSDFLQRVGEQND